MILIKRTPLIFTLLLMLIPIVSWSQDADGDGVLDPFDLDDDNDGILDKDEMFCASGWSGNWTDNGNNVYTANIVSQQITVSFNAPNGSYINGFHNGSLTTSNSAWYSNPAVAGQTSFVVNCAWDLSSESGSTDIDTHGDDKQTVYMTIDFGQYVQDPILHFDRLGGSGGGITNSGKFTLMTPGISLQKLSGTNDFDVTPTTINRTPDVAGNTNVESAQLASQGTAAGSVQFTGYFQTITFAYTGTGVEGLGFDTIEFVYGADVCFDLDSDNDGVPDREEEDSDDDGCPDVSEAGYTDQNLDAILGDLPLQVDPSNGLVIGSNVIDGYTGTSSAVTDGTPALTTVCSTILPVELCKFDLDIYGCNVDLKWVTCSEKNNAFFVVERSENGYEWTQIAQLEGMLNSTNETSYSFSDQDRKINGSYYYRLVQQDLDGTRNYSNTLSALVACDDAEGDQIVFAQSSVNEDVLVSTTNQFSLKSVVLSNLIGAEVMSYSNAIGKQVVVLDGSQISTGIYFVNCITTSGNTMSLKVFVK